MFLNCLNNLNSFSLTNFKLINKSNLKICIENSDLLNSIFQLDDADEIANIIQLELNVFINTIAPAKIVQFKKDYVPYYNNKIVEAVKFNNNLLENAIFTNNIDNWRLFRTDKATLNKNIEDAKTEYFKNQFKSKNDQWSFLKCFNNTKSTQQVPNNINHNGEQVTSSKAIATIANDFFKNKIKLIRESFTFTDFCHP